MLDKSQSYDQEYIDRETARMSEIEKIQRTRKFLKQHGTKLYIITTKELWPVKIGISAAPIKRLAALQIGNWVRLHIYRAFLFPSEMAFELEQSIHQTLDKQTLSGEWFGVSAAKAENIVESLLAGKGYALVNKD